MSQRESEATVRAAIDVLHKDNPLIELRPLMPDGRWWVGLYDDPEKLVRSILGLNAVEATAVYWSLNRIKPGRKITNSVGPAKKGCCIGNADIDRLRWLFLDIDNTGNRAAVDQLADDAQKYLSAKGWQAPVAVDSGTGRYLLYPCDLPATSKAIKVVIKSLKEQFDRAGAIIDAKCANPGRIARIPGTYNRKYTPRMATLGVAA